MSILIGIGNIETVSFDETEKALIIDYTDGHHETVSLSGLDNSEEIENETSARKTADTDIKSLVTAEATARSSADTSLQSSISAETERAQAAEQTNAENIESVKTTAESASSAATTLQTALGTETARAKEAEQTNATAAATAQTTADNAVTACSTEKDRATAAETSLNSKIETETERATAAEETNAGAITTETTRATNAENSISNTVINGSGLSHRYYNIDGAPVSGKSWCRIATSADYISSYNTLELSFFYAYDYAGTTPNAVGFVTFRFRQNGAATAIEASKLTQIQLNGDTEQTFKMSVIKDSASWYHLELYAKLTSYTKLHIFSITTFNNNNVISDNYKNEQWGFLSSGALTSSNTWTDGTTQNTENKTRSVIFSDTYSIDDAPTSGSSNLVKSGGVYTSISTAIQGTKTHTYEVSASDWSQTPASATDLLLGYTKSLVSVTDAPGVRFIKFKPDGISADNYDFIEAYFLNSTEYSLWVLMNNGISYSSYEVTAGSTALFLISTSSPYATMRIL